MAKRVEMFVQQVQDLITGVVEHDGGKSNKPQSDVKVEKKSMKECDAKCK